MKWRIVSRSSTWKLLRLNGWRGLFNLRAAHAYAYLRWQHRYASFLLRRVDPLAWNGLRRWLAQRYHSKVLAPDQARRVIEVGRQIPQQDLERVVPYPLARRIVLEANPRFVAYECACRHARARPCTPTQVCLFVGDPVAGFMLDHHPGDARQLSRDEALALLAAEHARGHVHTAWFKEALGERFYVICNCCACCCAGIQMMRRHGAPFLAPSGYVARLDPDRCRECGRCATVCPFAALRADEGGPRIDPETCMGCGVCVGSCPAGALSLTLEPRRGVPLRPDDLAVPATRP